jgi:hypothetical protein
METTPPDRKVLIGRAWNVALAAQNRENHTKKRTALAQQISIFRRKYKMRRLRPDSKEFTLPSESGS